MLFHYSNHMQTLQVVEDLQTDISSVSQQISNLLETLSAAIQQDECTSAQNAYSSLSEYISGQWINYAGYSPDGEYVGDASTILDILQENLQRANDHGLQAVLNQQDIETVTTWAQSILAEQEMYQQILGLGDSLIGSDTIEGGALQNCALAIYEDWLAESSQLSALDDRQYYGSLTQWVASLLVLQGQGVQMLQQANLWM
jgi:hypothetical protein